MTSPYTIPEVNTTGIDNVLTTVSSSVPIFTPFLLLFVFALVFILGYKKSREQGAGDAPAWATTAGIITTIVALILSLGNGIINTATLVSTIVITILCGAWLFSSNERQ